MTTFDNAWLLETASPLVIGILQDNLEVILDYEDAITPETRHLIDSYKRVLQDFMGRTKYEFYIAQLEEQYDGV